jgi:uncharacterized protein (TIGR02145 family)
MALNKRILFLTIFLFVEISVAATHVAVLETVSEKDVIGRSEKMFLTDKLRDRAKAVLPAYMGYVIMTRENINAMLPPGKSIEECEGSCLVETGKNISADFVAQARVGKFGKQLTLTVELYETAANNLIASFTTRKDDAVGLLEDIEQEADNFFKKILPTISVENKSPRIEESLSKPLSMSTSVLTDPRDGKKYRTVKIGSQIWMAENLNYAIKNSGCYEKQDVNCEKYGRLYTWKAASKICPEGWHLPNKTEFETLFNSVGGKAAAAKKLKTKNGWREGNGFDTYGFSALPAGSKDSKGKYDLKFLGTNFWSSSEKNNDKAASMYLSFYAESAFLGLDDKKNAFSVRCVKDSE